MASKPKIKMAQWGTKHGHARSVCEVMLENDDVDLVGVYEADSARIESIKDDSVWSQVQFLSSERDILDNPDIICVASEGLNSESLNQSEAIIDSGKHLWYDKPAGDDYPQWERTVAKARANGQLIQMGFMFRESWAFEYVSEWTHSGALGEVFMVRAHMSTDVGVPMQEAISVHTGGILYDLGAHMLDQIVWLLGRPNKITSIMRREHSTVPNFADNTVAIYEFDKAMAILDIAAMEPKPMARRFEVYGTNGSAILGPFDPPEYLRLVLNEPAAGYPAGITNIPAQPYRRHIESLVRLIACIRGEREPDRSYDHDLLVQETLMRTVGKYDPDGTVTTSFSL
ncbi:MAG: Gfo/Idh/MocA family oxidoreductase [Chloroflexi bacterium]|nr:Gfo/Idh/MocA family oxidoreductase [Chloroflexota bacterium]